MESYRTPKKEDHKKLTMEEKLRLWQQSRRKEKVPKDDFSPVRSSPKNPSIFSRFSSKSSRHSSSLSIFSRYPFSSESKRSSTHYSPIKRRSPGPSTSVTPKLNPMPQLNVVIASHKPFAQTLPNDPNQPETKLELELKFDSLSEDPSESEDSGCTLIQSRHGGRHSLDSLMCPITNDVKYEPAEEEDEQIVPSSGSDFVNENEDIQKESRNLAEIERLQTEVEIYQHRLWRQEQQIDDLQIKFTAMCDKEKEANHRADMALEEVQAIIFLNAILEQKCADIEASGFRDNLVLSEKLREYKKKNKHQTKHLLAEAARAQQVHEDSMTQLQDQLKQIEVITCSRIQALESELLFQRQRADNLESVKKHRDRQSSSSSSSNILRRREAGSITPVKGKAAKSKNRHSLMSSYSDEGMVSTLEDSLENENDPANILSLNRERVSSRKSLSSDDCAAK